MMSTYRAIVDDEGAIRLLEPIKLKEGTHILVTVADKATLVAMMRSSGQTALSEERLREQLEEDEAWAYLLKEDGGDDIAANLDIAPDMVNNVSEQHPIPTSGAADSTHLSDSSEKNTAVASQKGKGISIPECICGCRNENGTKVKKDESSRFLPGHDPRLKGKIARVSEDRAAPGFKFPTVALDFARNNPGATVVKPYTSEFLLEQAARLERGEGVRQ